MLAVDLPTPPFPHAICTIGCITLPSQFFVVFDGEATHLRRPNRLFAIPRVLSGCLATSSDVFVWRIFYACCVLWPALARWLRNVDNGRSKPLSLIMLQMSIIV